jgi:hypothetical protein
MIGVSARSYVAAGLATAITGAMVVTPVLAHTQQVALPSVQSANVELSSFVSFAENTASHALKEAAVGVSAVKNAVDSVAPSSHGTTAAAGVTASGAATVPTASTTHASNTAAVQGGNSVNAPAAAAAPPNPLQAIVSGALLLSAIPVIVTAQALVTSGEDAGFGTLDALVGLATNNMTEANAGFKLIGQTFSDFATATMADFATLKAEAQAFFNPGSTTGTGTGTGTGAASTLKSVAAVTPSSAALTKNTSTKTSSSTSAASKTSGTASTPKASTVASQKTAPSVNSAVNNSTATKTATTSASSASTTHQGQTSASSASNSAPKHASTGVSAPKHAAAGAKGHK